MRLRYGPTWVRTLMALYKLTIEERSVTCAVVILWPGKNQRVCFITSQLFRQCLQTIIQPFDFLLCEYLLGDIILHTQKIEHAPI
jgi:hypothetical protein